jgi:hypothetical protein
VEIRQPPTDPTDSVDMGIEVGDADLVNGDAQGPPQPNASAPPAQEFDAFGEDHLDQETRNIKQGFMMDTTAPTSASSDFFTDIAQPIPTS